MCPVALEINFMTQPRIDTVIQLPDKRNLAYAEYGDADGLPVFLFHGLPGSRLSWGLIPDHPFPPDIRIIAPDRPGYGKSDPKPGRTLLDWADDRFVDFSTFVHGSTFQRGYVRFCNRALMTARSMLHLLKASP